MTAEEKLAKVVELLTKKEGLYFEGSEAGYTSDEIEEARGDVDRELYELLNIPQTCGICGKRNPCGQACPCWQESVTGWRPARFLDRV